MEVNSIHAKASRPASLSLAKEESHEELQKNVGTSSPSNCDLTTYPSKFLDAQPYSGDP